MLRRAARGRYHMTAIGSGSGLPYTVLQYSFLGARTERMASTDPATTPAAWLIRAGKYGEDEDFNLKGGLASIGWSELPDLRSVSSLVEMKRLVREADPDATERSVSVQANQLWRFKTEVQVGDLVVLPLKTTGQIALGAVTRDYWYREDEDARRHVVSVNWKRTDAPRSDIKQDLRYSLGSQLTICSIARNDGAWRLHQVMAGGRDPGRRPNRDPTTPHRDITVDGETTDSPEAVDLEDVARDRILSFVEERFQGHALSRLVAKVLEAEGFITEDSPPGPDGGIDILAGRGPLGLDEPRIVVQVKSGSSPVGAQVVRELNGVLAGRRADQGLLVAWAGVTRTARRELRGQFFSVRVWNANDLLNAVFRNYDKLGEKLQADLPLKQVWVLIED